MLVQLGKKTPIQPAEIAEAGRLRPPQYLPTTLAEARARGWDELDVVIVTGDAYVDHPAFGPDVVRQLIEVYGRSPPRSIIVPVFTDRRGHPVLIAWRHVAGLRGHPAGEGVNAYLRRHAADTREVAVDSPGVLTDLDTPADYERYSK